MSNVAGQKWCWCCIEIITNIIGVALRPALIGKAGYTLHADRRSWVHNAVPIRKIHRFFIIRCASPISGVWIAEPIISVQHKGAGRIGEARTPICRALSVILELHSSPRPISNDWIFQIHLNFYGALPLRINGSLCIFVIDRHVEIHVKSFSVTF